jgi:hypothetical protein
MGKKSNRSLKRWFIALAALGLPPPMWPCPQLPWLVLTAIETAVSARPQAMLANCRMNRRLTVKMESLRRLIIFANS